MSKQRRKPAPEPTPATARDPRLDLLLPLAGGALATLLAAGMMGMAVTLLWKPVATNGGLILRTMAFMAVCGGAVAGALGRSQIKGTPVAAAAAALGWAIWGLSAHVIVPGKFYTFLPPDITEIRADVIFFTNALTHCVAIGMGVILAAVAARVLGRFLAKSESNAMAPPSDAGNFRNALSYPALLLVSGGALFMLCGLAALPFGYSHPQTLPSPVPLALWCGLWSFLAFGASGFLIRRYFATTGSIGYAVAPPLTVAAIAAFFLLSGFSFPLILPAVLLIWHSSPVEASAWGSLGSCVGYMLAARKNS